MIITKGLTKMYDDVHGIRGIDLTVRDGASLGLLGRNGAGKTTLIRALIGLIKADSGIATVNGLDINADADRVRKVIGYLPEAYGLYDEMTVYNILDYTARLHRIEAPARKQRIEELLRTFELESYRNMKAGTLSKGLRQKLGFARALVNDPQVIFLDEPTSGLDPIAARSIENIVAGLKRQGKTVLITSHILPEVEKMCDDIALIKEGRIVVSGRLEDIKRQYAMPSVIVRLKDHESVGRAMLLLKPMVTGRMEPLDDGLTVYTQDPDSVTPIVNKALMDASIPVLEIKRAEESLGDIYFKVLEE
ncbi:ABC transporter ATP binding protein [Methanocella paludicola SANAE]|uniref:ABC transporter ATP binding protein n=2 Tax=Methanocella TaxID=570266 RepID=D1YYC3_METPS|nr:ABC transporter ATP binding protein [Methanocella paludicola SANAE]